MDEQAIYRAIGRRLRQRRRLLSMTQGEVARACRVSFQQIQKYEAGVSGIPAAKLVSLAIALEILVSYFVDHLDPEGRPFEIQLQPLQVSAG